MKAKGKSLVVGIVGCGRIAAHHLKFLVHLENVEIAGLVDINISQAKMMGEKYGIKQVFSSLDELLNFKTVDVLHILTPPLYHYDLALQAIERGIHLLIEKPITLSLEETEKLYQLAEEKNVKICPNFLHLFNPIILNAKEAIKQNDLGKLILAECYYSIDLNDPELNEPVGLHWSYELPGGIMQNNLTHPLYLVLDWIGKAKKITTGARQFGSLPQGVTDHIDVFIKGARANGNITITVSPKHENYYLKLFFDKGTVTVDFITQMFTIDKVNRLPRAVNRVVVNFNRSKQLSFGSIRNVVDFLRKKLVTYYGIKNIIDSFYGWVIRNNIPPVSREMSLDVCRAEEIIGKNSGKVCFSSDPRPSTQESVTKQKKVLITGSTGYVGSELVRQLVNAGYYVRAYVRKNSHTELLEELGVELFYGDIREEDALGDAAKGMNVIIHAAAALKGSRSFLMDSCVNGTKNVAEAARQAEVRKVIYISSFGIYDYVNLKDGGVLNEESLLETQGEMRGVYSWAKRKAEDIALSNLSDDGPAWTVLRPSLIFGNGHDLIAVVGPKIGKFVVSFGKKEKHLKLLHVKDVASAVLLAIENDSTRNRIFNLSHRDKITVDSFMKNFCQPGHAANIHMINISYNTGLVAVAMLKGLKALLGRGPSLNKIQLAYLCRDVVAESDAFYNATGWQTEETLLSQLRKEI
jgi:predicted dehydrogenase/nucleoside-diphosphate-sugar epimerase